MTPLNQPTIDEILFAYQQWVSDGLGPDLRLPGKRLTHEEAKQAIYSRLASEAVEITNTADYRVFEVIPISKLKEVFGVEE
jgi:hypothetical protein